MWRWLRVGNSVSPARRRPGAESEVLSRSRRRSDADSWAPAVVGENRARRVPEPSWWRSSPEPPADRVERRADPPAGGASGAEREQILERAVRRDRAAAVLRARAGQLFADDRGAAAGVGLGFGSAGALDRADRRSRAARSSLCGVVLAVMAGPARSRCRAARRPRGSSAAGALDSRIGRRRTWSSSGTWITSTRRWWCARSIQRLPIWTRASAVVEVCCCMTLSFGLSGLAGRPWPGVPPLLPVRATRRRARSARWARRRPCGRRGTRRSAR